MTKKFPRHPVQCGHLAEFLGLMSTPGYGPSATFWKVFPTDELNCWSASITGLLWATIGHHGRPMVELPSARMDPAWWSKSDDLDPFEGIAELIDRSKVWFPEAWAADAATLPENPEFQHGWAGLVMLADWLGSDAIRFFPFGDSLEEDRMAFARHQSRRALRSVGLEAAGARRQLDQAAVGFHVFPYIETPRPAQRVMFDLPVPRKPSLTILEAETGSGKTEAAILHYLKLFQAGQVDGMYFALPTRTAATQIYERVCRAVAAAFPGKASRPPVVLAVPGYISTDAVEGVPLPGFEVKWPDDTKDRFRYRGWAAEGPKRYLAGAVAVGTVDQVLLSTLAVSHAHLRATALTRQLLVVDEVHASDVYMTRLLESVLDHHSQAGGHALLMSATLGSGARSRLLAPSGLRRAASPPPEPEAAEMAYPLVSIRDDADVGSIPVVETSQESQESQEKDVLVSVRPLLSEPDAIAKMVLDTARKGARTLVIRNTVGGCRELQGALERLAEATDSGELLFRCRSVIAPHHGRYAKPDREVLDRAIEKELGRKRPSGEGLVVIATQTVEQSLDLDADFMITDLCPMDVLLQRIGRLHRHVRERPRGFEQACVLILLPTEEDLSPFLRESSGKAQGPHGLGTVYDDARSLQATWDLLLANQEIVIPRDNRRLVEGATHPEVLEEIVRRLRGSWRKHQEHVLGSALADGHAASLNSLRRDLTFDETPDVLFPDERRIPTRLGEDDRRVVLPEPRQSPFRERVAELRIPGWFPGLERVDADDYEAKDVTRLSGGGFRFRLGPLSFRYDRLGLALEPEET